MRLLRSFTIAVCVCAFLVTSCAVKDNVNGHGVGRDTSDTVSISDTDAISETETEPADPQNNDTEPDTADTVDSHNASTGTAEDTSTEPAETDGNGYYFNDYLGISRSQLLDWLLSHEEDDYYLGTPYGSELYGFNTDTCMRPYGRFKDGSAQMTCTGFVLDALIESAGENGDELHSRVIDMMNMCESNGWANDIEYYRNEVNAYYWGAFFRNYENGKIEHYFFDTISEMLESKILKKGDLIFFMPEWTVYGSDANGNPTDMYGNTIDCHIGFYWGEDLSGEDLFWHSMGAGLTGDPMDKSLGAFNQISEMTTPSVYAYIIAVPIR